MLLTRLRNALVGDENGLLGAWLMEPPRERDREASKVGDGLASGSRTRGEETGLNGSGEVNS